MFKRADTVHALRAAGISLVVDLEGALPRVLHWGADLGPVDARTAAALYATSIPAVLNNSPDVPRAFSVWPTEQDGWAGTPAQVGNRGGTATTPVLVWSMRSSSTTTRVAASCSSSTTTWPARAPAWNIDWMSRACCRRTCRSRTPAAASAGPYLVDGLRALLPLPDRATEVLDFHRQVVSRTGSPADALCVRDARASCAARRTPGHHSPYLLAAGTAGFGFAHGEVWGVHLAWSGDSGTSPNGCPKVPAFSRA